IPGEHHDGGPAAEQLRVLHGVAAKSAGAENRHDTIRSKHTGSPQLFDSAVGRHPRICQRRKLLPLQFMFDTDEVFVRDGYELGVTTGGPKARPASVLTYLLISESAWTAYSVTPTGSDNYLIADSQLSRFGHVIPYRFYQACDLVPWCYGKAPD